MAKTNPVIRLGLTDDQKAQDPILSAVADSAKLLFTDAFTNVGCSSNLTTVMVGNHSNCIFLGDAPTAATADRQLCIGGVRSQANVGGAYYQRVPLRIKDAGGNDVTKYIHIFDA